MARRLIVATLLSLPCIVALPIPAVAQEFDVTLDEPELRYQFMAHDFTTNGVEREIYIKLDRFTGKTWRFSANLPRWEAIPEPIAGRARRASSISRYELLPHDYLDDDGDAHEMYLRVDMVTGFTWSYQGAAASWNDVPQTD